MAAPTTVSTSDIARIADVGRATVTNWRRRHSDFPAPTGGTESRPTFTLEDVEGWLAEHGRLPQFTEQQQLWRELLREAEGPGLTEAMARAALFLAFLEREGRTSPETHYVHYAEDPDLDEDGLGDGMLDEIRRALQGMPEPLSLLRSASLMRELAAAATRQAPDEVLTDLLDRYASESRGRGPGTPEAVARFMATLAEAASPDQVLSAVLDPACGMGDLLEAARIQGATQLDGQDRDLHLAQLAAARLSLRLGGEGRCSIEAEEALTQSRHTGGEFDAVLCNPPYNERDWGADDLAYDSRWEYGLPSRSESELAWVQHCLSRVRPGGVVVMLLPPSVASRSSGRRIRAALVRQGALRAVLSLPAGVALPAHIGLHLWVLRRPGGDNDTEGGHVLFMNCRSLPDTNSRGGRPTVTHRELLTAPEECPDAPGVYRAVPITDLLDDTVDLTPAPRLAGARDLPRVDDLRRTLSGRRDSLGSVLSQASALAPSDEWGVSRTGGPWTMVPLADLIRTGALALLRPKLTGGNGDSGGGHPVLTAADVNEGRPPSGRGQAGDEDAVRIRAGDVIIPGTLLSADRSAARVADANYAGALLGRNLHLLRPDEARLDPWFLSGFLADPANVQRASQGTSIVRVDARRLQVPLLPLEEQQTYGAAFRRLHTFTTALRRAALQGEETAGQLRAALTAGALRPPPPA
ncbi:N-6 DNA methylase [Streptomyces sp. NPDC096097]|uniref:N-6 DNA methylase n=1 Tax=Streptomyces sp. NPDC096097 TaxID=3155546 RepID=UPI003317BCA5